ncbi:RNA-directed DNA polymerase from mobile element jockey-like [Plakobranchus ocellatus]|uniref:RNA-directed DNA polymerase from mobile element jockey-like n=1 Tax=Plakobranchus ocellatus TaxID=259542 RepID=A0AAV3ZEY4_9GAST|nr:RNA-directed DNA polymerase from mobile element jockey-like [Plakobranchus ocellatus]
MTHGGAHPSPCKTTAEFLLLGARLLKRGPRVWRLEPSCERRCRGTSAPVLQLRSSSQANKGTIPLQSPLYPQTYPNILATFQANIGGRFASLLALDNDQDLTPDDLVETFNETLPEEASKLLGKPRVKKKKWMTGEILALCDQRRSLKKRKKEPENGKQYRETNLKVKRSIKEATEKWNEDQCEDIENSLKHNNSDKAYKIVKELTDTKQARVTTIESKEGKCLTEEKEILERWTEYCSELYTHVATKKDPNVLNVPPSPNNARHSILRAEIIAAVSSLKPGKSAGIDNITGEMVQAGGEATIDMLFLICNKILQIGV